MSRLGQFVLVAAAATFATVLVRAIAGEALGSDAYSHLVWARDAVNHGITSHAPFDYTVPKPFAAGRRRARDGAGSADVRVRVGLARRRLRVRARGCGAGTPARALPGRAAGRPLHVLPAGALARRAAGRLQRALRRARRRGRGGRHGNARLRRPARGRGHAAAGGMGARRASTPCSGGARRTLADARPLGRLGSRAAGALGHARSRLHGRLVVVEQHRRRLQRALPAAAAASLRRCPAAVVERVGDVSTWPVALLALAALVVRPQAAPARRGSRLSAGARGGPARGRGARARSRPTTSGACSRRSPCSPPRARPWRWPRTTAGLLRGSLAVVAVAAVPLAAAPWLAGAVRDVRDQSRQARGLAARSSRRHSSARRRRATWRCRASGRASSRSPGIARAARSSRRA